jgi:hypothetical protein
MSTNDQNLGCLGAIFRLFGGGGAKATKALPSGESFPYRVRDDFLSPAEMSFYHVLTSVVGVQALVCPKVGLSDIFFVTRPHENHSAKNRIAQKHVDFLLCQPGTMKPLVGIELDDASHSRSDRQARDEFVQQLFAAAQLPLVRVPVQRGYHRQEVLAQLRPILAASTGSPADEPAGVMPTLGPAESSAGVAPECPKCGVPMVVRRAGRGERQGEQFYGCANYPKCRETRPVGEPV